METAISGACIIIGFKATSFRKMAKWQNGKVANPEISVNGNEVIVLGQYSSRGYSSTANFLFTVENGLITSWRIRY